MTEVPEVPENPKSPEAGSSTVSMVVVEVSTRKFRIWVWLTTCRERKYLVRQRHPLRRGNASTR